MEYVGPGPIGWPELILLSFIVAPVVLGTIALIVLRVSGSPRRDR